MGRTGGLAEIPILIQPGSCGITMPRQDLILTVSAAFVHREELSEESRSVVAGEDVRSSEGVVA